jgi:DNA-binding protein HU-beta
MAKTMSKSELIQRIVDGHHSDIPRKDVKEVIEAVAEIGHKELKKTGAFVVPGLAKFTVIKGNSPGLLDLSRARNCPTFS